MSRRLSRRPAWRGLLAAYLLQFILTACVKMPTGPKSGDPFLDRAPKQLHSASVRTEPKNAGGGTGKHFILPNPALLGCNAGNCTQILPDQVADPDAVYPWQVLVDFNGGKVIGLIALYDQPNTIEDLQEAVDQQYGQWAMADFRSGPVRLWRVEPPRKFVINLTVAASGMVQLVYLTYDPKHPASEQAIDYEVCLMEKAAKCADRRHSARWLPDFLR